MIIIDALSALVGNYLEKISDESCTLLSNYYLVNLATAIFPLFTQLMFFIVKYSSLLFKKLCYCFLEVKRYSFHT